MRCNADVESIVVEDGRATGVRLSVGREDRRSDIVVSNADSAWTYRKLLPPEARRRWTDRKHRARAATRWACSSGISAPSGNIPTSTHHTIMLGPRYRGLLDDIFKRKMLAEDFSLYLHRPTATDPSLAPPGCDAFYVLSPVPNLDGGTDWAPRPSPTAARIAEHLCSDAASGP